jgi:hypothetical protein
LPLEVTGADAAAFQVVIQGLPPGVTPSRGVAVGPSTWVLGRDDLGGLFLTLDAGAPAAFDLKVGVSISPGVAAAGSIVQVRLLGDELKQAAAAGGAAGTPPGFPALWSIRRSRLRPPGIRLSRGRPGCAAASSGGPHR